MNEELLSKLHDIKDIEKIPDNSIFIFSILVFFVILILLIIIFYVIKLYRNRKKSDRKKYYEILEKIDFINSKETAYTISKYSKIIAISEREKKLADELIEELEKYKYRKDVEKISDNIKVKYSIFMDTLDV